jgi:branched-chain amino acid transport system ATP-binding protein
MINGPPLLELSEVSAEYDGKTALAGVNLEVADGEIVALIGSNGAGKSTLLKAIMGLVAASNGEIRFGGRLVQNGRPFATARLGIGYLPQGAPAFVELTVMQNLSIAGLYLDKAKLREQVAEAIELFPALGERLNQKAGVLSGGERQMLGIARSFIANPKLLLLDEPSSGLHPDLTAIVFDKLRQLSLRYKVAILIVEQNIMQVLDISQRVYGLRRGRIVEGGNSEVFKEKELLRSLFVD